MRSLRTALSFVQGPREKLISPVEMSNAMHHALLTEDLCKSVCCITLARQYITSRHRRSSLSVLVGYPGFRRWLSTGMPPQCLQSSMVSLAEFHLDCGLTVQTGYFAKIQHAVCGIYIWELVNSFAFDWTLAVRKRTESMSPVYARLVRDPINLCLIYPNLCCL